MSYWDYAQLSNTAKKMGGPQKMVEAIAFKARSQGRMDIVPWMGVAMLTGIGLNWLYERSKELLKAKTISRKEKTEQTKEAEGAKTTA